MPPAARNVLLITSDQQHWSTLGCLNGDLRTPNLDRLAARGTLFTRAYCPNPTCTPTRASIITGRYPSQHGAWSLGTKLLESEHTVGEDFQGAGVRTALVGKAHFQPTAGTCEHPSLEAFPTLQDLEFWRGFHGPFYGFEHVELARNHTDEAYVGQHYALWMERKGLADWRAYFRPPTGTNDRQRRTWEIPEAFHYGTWIAERSCDLLDGYAERGERFFLWASFLDPHPTYLVPEPWDSMYDPAALAVPAVQPGEHDANPPHFRLKQKANPDRDELARDIACYYGMISLMDAQIGRILDRLEALGLASDTLVVFTSDHGHLFGQHGMTGKGAFHYEDLIRVPLIVAQPGVVPAGRRSDALQSLVDFAPSFLAAAGIGVPAAMTGIDQTDVWYGRRPSLRDHVVVENRHEPTTEHLKTYVEDRYKLTVYFQRDYGELFDLAADPGEVDNLWDVPEAQELPELKNELTRKLLFAEMGKEPLPMPRIAGA